MASPLALPPTTWRWLLASALATVAAWACYFRALKLGEASPVNAVDKRSLVRAAVLAFRVPARAPDSREWLGVGLASGDALLLALKR